MTADLMLTLEKAMQAWQPPEIPEDIPQGDTPGDKIWIGPQQKEKAAKIFPVVLPMLREVLEKSPAKTSGYYGVRWIRRGKNGYFVPFDILF